MSEINDLMTQISQVSNEKGLWLDYFEIINKMKSSEDTFSIFDIERVKLAFINEKISLVSSELGESTESMRNNNFCLLKKDQLDEMMKIKDEEMGDIKFQASYRTHIKDTLQDEMADAIIRILDICYKMDIDIEKHIILKMEYNKTRNVKHGKKF